MTGDPMFPRIHDAIVDGAREALTSWLEAHTATVLVAIIVVAAVSGFIGGRTAAKSV